MKLDTDKAQAMSLNIEQERREFDAWSETNKFYRTHVKDKSYTPQTQKLALEIWLAAKLAARSAGLSQEPVAWVLNKELESRETTCKAHLWFSDPVNSGWTAIFTAPPAPVSAEILDLLNHWCVLGIGMECNAPIPLNLVARTKAVLASTPAAPLSDAKDSEGGCNEKT